MITRVTTNRVVRATEVERRILHRSDIRENPNVMAFSPRDTWADLRLCPGTLCHICFYAEPERTPSPKSRAPGVLPEHRQYSAHAQARSESPRWHARGRRGADNRRP